MSDVAARRQAFLLGGKIIPQARAGRRDRRLGSCACSRHRARHRRQRAVRRRARAGRCSSAAARWCRWCATRRSGRGPAALPRRTAARRRPRGRGCAGRGLARRDRAWSPARMRATAPACWRPRRSARGSCCSAARGASRAGRTRTEAACIAGETALLGVRPPRRDAAPDDDLRCAGRGQRAAPRRAAASPAVVPLPGGGRALVQPIHQDDVTRCDRWRRSSVGLARARHAGDRRAGAPSLRRFRARGRACRRASAPRIVPIPAGDPAGARTVYGVAAVPAADRHRGDPPAAGGQGFSTSAPCLSHSACARCRSRAASRARFRR